MYKHTLRAADQYFERGLVLPKNTFAVCGTPLAAGAHAGSLAVTVAAAGPVALAAGKMLTLGLEESNDGLVYRVSPVSCSFSFAKTVAADDGEVLARFVLPDSAKLVRVRVGTNDAAASGKVDVFLEYLAR